MLGLPVVYEPMSASGVIKDRNGEFYGLICNASASGIVTFYDNPSAASGDVVAGPITLVAGTPVLFNGIGVKFCRGLFMQLVSGTAQLNVLIN